MLMAFSVSFPQSCKAMATSVWSVIPVTSTTYSNTFSLITTNTSMATKQGSTIWMSNLPTSPKFLETSEFPQF
jgi:hypothetical protein